MAETLASVFCSVTVHFGDFYEGEYVLGHTKELLDGPPQFIKPDFQYIGKKYVLENLMVPVFFL